MAEARYWTCPKCGHHLIELVQTGVTVVTEVYVVGGGSDLEFGDQQNHDGDEAWFQCRNCGSKICDGGPEELLEHLELPAAEYAAQEELDNTYPEGMDDGQCPE